MPKRLYLVQQTMPIDAVTKTGATREDMQRMHDTHTWPQQYLVKKVVGATVPRIGAYLTEAEAQGYCADEAWQVEVTGQV